MSYQIFFVSLQHENNKTLKIMKTKKATKTRKLYEIANEIRKDWKNIYFGAQPYLNAMGCLESIDDYYYLDSAKSVVRYFLANASTWRGETARRIKKELQMMVR